MEKISCSLNDAGKVPSNSKFVVLRENKKIITNSLAVYLLDQGCCGLDMFMPYSSVDKSLKVSIKNSPKHCDVMVFSGEITNKVAPIIRHVYDEMAFPKWVVAVGSCACSGGLYSSYSLVRGVDKIVPVDIQVVGCPPDPSLIFDVFKFITNKD
ncbi:MAG: NADH-quinone oxidoreductase subunit NuoB [Alphaproteobacteria bacterium]